jgi:hypothetical protein
VCIDQTNWRFRPYPKHETPPSFRDRDHADIDRLTLGADSRYYREHPVEHIEKQVIQLGVYVQSHKAHKILKIHEFPEFVGASSGEASRWVKVEITNDEFHGRPITADEFRRHMARQIPCCP